MNGKAVSSYNGVIMAVAHNSGDYLGTGSLWSCRGWGEALGTPSSLTCLAPVLKRLKQLGTGTTGAPPHSLSPHSHPTGSLEHGSHKVVRLLAQWLRDTKVLLP
jgi:hypothetical protein